MKKFYTISVRALCACCLLGFSVADAQLSVMGVGFYSVGGVSDNGVVSMDTSGGDIFKWDAQNGLVQIGSLTNGYPSSGRTVISNNGTKIGSSATNAATSFNEISTYDVATSTWVNQGGLVPTGWDGSVSSTWGMTPNANTIVGLGHCTCGKMGRSEWSRRSWKYGSRK